MVRFCRDDRVVHTRFGPGVVIDANDRYTVIEFDDSSVRKFVTTLLQIEGSDLPRPMKPAPVKRRKRRAGTSMTLGAT